MSGIAGLGTVGRRRSSAPETSTEMRTPPPRHREMPWRYAAVARRGVKIRRKTVTLGVGHGGAVHAVIQVEARWNALVAMKLCLHH